MIIFATGVCVGIMLIALVAAYFEGVEQMERGNHLYALLYVFLMAAIVIVAALICFLAWNLR